MRALVTGCAGFVGSHLTEKLLTRGTNVRGIDALTTYYDPTIKRSNLARVADDPRFEFVEADLRAVELSPLLDGIDVVFHLAGQPGVRVSWSDGFGAYVEHNVLATQRLLEALRVTDVGRIVYASSSSVYGNASAYPTTEEDLPRPHSPYGVTKLAGEHLCRLYAENFSLPTVSLRYFTVYGPRQRPDMGFARFFDAIASHRPITVYGDGEQVRDFTFVSDVVDATVAAAQADVVPGSVYNVAGGSEVSVNRLLEILTEVVESPIRVEYGPEQPGDVRHTGGSIERARRDLGWQPNVELLEGLARQWEWRGAAPAPGSGC